MTDKNIKKLEEYWIKIAQEDLDSAKSIASKARRYVQALFFIHLANEKILKAYCVHIKREHAPYSHNLVHLAQVSGLELSNHQIKILNEINEFNLSCRYPDQELKIYKKANAAVVKKYILFTEEFFKWMFEKLKNL